MFYVDDGLVDLVGSMFEIRKIGEPEDFLGIHTCRDLLCGVFVQLHLALFPAGGPFLPSLSVTLYIISGALRELSVALCRGNASLCRSGAYVATSAAGRAPIRGLAQLSAEVV
jgi:hypothetical protein